MSPERDEPYAGYNFRVEIDGIEAGAFSEVSGLGVEVPVIEYRDGSEPSSARKIPGIAKYSNLTLRRGLTSDLTLWDWMRESVEGRPSRRSLTVVLLDEERQEVLRWRFHQAWPCKYDPADLNATSNEAGIETLEITHEGLEIERP